MYPERKSLVRFTQRLRNFLEKTDHYLQKTGDEQDALVDTSLTYSYRAVRLGQARMIERDPELSLKCVDNLAKAFMKRGALCSLNGPGESEIQWLSWLGREIGSFEDVFNEASVEPLVRPITVFFKTAKDPVYRTKLLNVSCEQIQQAFSSEIQR